MLSTPSTSHITSFDNIYEPAEDSFLLLDTLSLPSQIDFLTSRFSPSDDLSSLSPSNTPPLVLEVGTGSGVVLSFVAAHATTLLGRSDISLLGTDINILAARASHRTATRSLSDAYSSGNPGAGFLDTVTADLVGPVRQHEVDVLIFNPPYVPTENVPVAPASQSSDVLSSDQRFQRDSHLLELSYAGGEDGMVVTNRLLEALPQILSDRGIAFVLLCAQNKPAAVVSQIQSWSGNWQAEIVGSSGKKAGWESLSILRIWR